MAVRILEYVAKHWPDKVSSATLVEELKLNRSTCYNILGTLEKAGWAESQGHGWTLGPRLLVITGVTDRVRDRLVQEEIDALSEELGFIVFVAAREHSGGYRVVAVGERVSGVRVSVGLGDTFPFSAPAIMHAFFAWTDPEKVRALLAQNELPRFTEHSITDAERLAAVFRSVRRTGYSKSLRQYEIGQGGIASPIFDGKGQVYQVVCSLAFASQLNANTVKEVGSRIRDCADRITRGTGGVFPEGYRHASRERVS